VAAAVIYRLNEGFSIPIKNWLLIDIWPLRRTFSMQECPAAKEC
jgi:hypothetical protein